MHSRQTLLRLLTLCTSGILNVIDPGLSAHLRSVRNLTSSSLNFQRKRQGMFTSGTFESVSISFTTAPSEWGPRMTGVNVLPRATGKGRVINLSDVGEVLVEGGGRQVVIRGKGGDLLFHGVCETSTPPGTCDEIKAVVDYEVKGLLKGDAGREEARGRQESLEEKSALEKKVYFAKREVEMMAKRKKVS